MEHSIPGTWYIHLPCPLAGYAPDGSGPRGVEVTRSGRGAGCLWLFRRCGGFLGWFWPVCGPGRSFLVRPEWVLAPVLGGCAVGRGGGGRGLSLTVYTDAVRAERIPLEVDSIVLMLTSRYFDASERIKTGFSDGGEWGGRRNLSSTMP